MGTKNLGLVQAIWVGTSAPSNTSMLWYDISEGVNLHKYYKISSSTWETFVINSATAPLSKEGVNILLIYDTDQFEVVAGKLSIKAGIISPPFTISDITGLTTALNNKVTVVAGKSLMSDAEILRLASVGNYTHPSTHSPSIISQDSINRFVTDAEKEAWSGKQDSLGFTPYDSSNPDGYITEEYLTTHKIPDIQAITLPNASTVAARCSGAVEGTDYPTGWTIGTATYDEDLLITHTLDKKVSSVTIWTNEGENDRLLISPANYTGLIMPLSNTLVIEGLAQTSKPIIIYITFV
jgi:hypothetical protein